MNEIPSPPVADVDGLVQTCAVVEAVIPFAHSQKEAELCWTEELELERTCHGCGHAQP